MNFVTKLAIRFVSPSDKSGRASGLPEAHRFTNSEKFSSWKLAGPTEVLQCLINSEKFRHFNTSNIPQFVLCKERRKLARTRKLGWQGLGRSYFVVLKPFGRYYSRFCEFHDSVCQFGVMNMSGGGFWENCAFQTHSLIDPHRK